MSSATSPFPLPETLERELSRVLAYWEGLRRAENSMPFWDDLNLSSLPDHSVALVLIDVFEKPERFRFNAFTGKLAQITGDSLIGKFADESDLRDPFAFFRAQCSATVEARTPTYYRSHPRDSVPYYARLLLPMWGNGHIGMLLGAVDWR